MEKKVDRITVTRSQIKKIMVGSAMAGALFATAISTGVSVAKTSYQKYKGSQIITREVNESGLLPKGLSSTEDYNLGRIYFYQDAYGNRQRVLDTDSFFNDIAVESYDFGLSPAQVAVAFDYGYGYNGDIVGVTDKAKDQAKMVAYLEMNINKEAHK